MNMDHYSLLLLLFAALMCPLLSSAAPPTSTDQETENGTDLYNNWAIGENDTDNFTTIDTIPYTDFTPFINLNNSLENILAEVLGSSTNIQQQGRRFTRPCACSSTNGAYGGGSGVPWLDIRTNPCHVQIRNIWIRSGRAVVAIQVQYRFASGTLWTAPRRGGNGGNLYHIPVYPGEKIIGIFGSTGVYYGYTVVSRLYILKLTASNTVRIYGPYGDRASAATFVVIGDIKSFFGRSGGLLDALGMYYEPWGACN